MDSPIYHLEKVVKARAEALEDFTGPLDLILHLLSKNKMEIKDIQISVILEQYLAWMERRKKLDLEVASEFVTMWVTFRVQKRSTYGQPQEVEITKRLEDEGVDVDGQVISITLTQADTLLLGSLDPETDQTVEVQIRGKTADGRAFASNIMTAPVSRILKDGQI